MEILFILFLILLGALIGLITGLLGIGGGFITVPVLMYLLNIFYNIPVNQSIKIAIGTSLFVLLINSIVSSYYQHNNNNILWKFVIVLGLFGIIGSIIGTYISKILNDKYHILLFGILLILISLNILINNFINKNNNNSNNNNNSSNKNSNSCTSNYIICFIGLFAGVMSSLFGIGGGILLLPILHHYLKYNIRKAIGTSTAIVVIISFFGLLGYIFMDNNLNKNIINNLLIYGNVSISIGLIMILTGVVFSKIGVNLSNKLNTNILNIILSIILFITGLKMIFS